MFFDELKGDCKPETSLIAEEDAPRDSPDLPARRIWRSLPDRERIARWSPGAGARRSHPRRKHPLSGGPSLLQEILVAAEQHAVERPGAIQQRVIRHPRRAIRLRGEHIHTAPHQLPRHGGGHMNVHVEGDAHSFPISRSLRRSGESDDRAARLAARFRPCSICSSNSAW